MSLSDLQVADNTVVAFHYKLTNSSGEVLDESEDEPMYYLHGAQNIVPGLERQMGGHRVGDKFTAQVPAAEAYGERAESVPQHVPLEAFPEDMPLFEGMPLTAETNDGQLLHFFVLEVHEDAVVLDTNHPLAGEDLTFEVEITAIRAATESEIEHGHPHGADGHDHHH